MQIFNGAIVTCNEDDDVLEYLVTDRGKILHAGNELPEEYRGAEVTALEGRALLPAFGDAHLHFSNWALVADAFFDVRAARDFSDLAAMIEAFVDSDPKTKILAAFGASRHSVKERRLITREELDAIHSDRPLYIICYDGHSAIANSRLIELLPDEVKGMRGFHADTGHMLHEAFFGATDHVSSAIPPLMLIRSIAAGYDRLAAKGIGLIHTSEGIGFPRDLDITMVSLAARAMTRKKAYQTRLFFQTMEVKKVLGRKLPRIGGCFATALDGCFGVCDAALLEPYTNDPDSRGILFYSDEEVVAFVKQANRAELQISIHTIGDAAVDQALLALEAAQEDYPRQDTRHILIHACLLSPEQLDRCAALELGLTMQPSFLVSPLEPVEYLREILGDRVDRSSPLRDIVDRGIHLSGGSDGPVTHPDPVEGIFGACNHPYDPGQSLTIPEALRMYTREVAWMSFDDQERGSLEPGKIADMVIMNRNPLELDRADLRELEVEQLMLSGRPYRPGMGVLSLISNGALGRRVKI